MGWSRDNFYLYNTMCKLSCPSVSLPVGGRDSGQVKSENYLPMQKIIYYVYIIYFQLYMYSVYYFKCKFGVNICWRFNLEKLLLVLEE